MSAVLEGEVLDPTSADVEVRVAALRGLDVQSQMTAVTVMLSDSRTRLLAAIAVHDLPGICDVKVRTATLQEITKQLRLGKDMQMDAAEFVRRAERGLGVAIREGQARGELETKSEALSRGAIERDIKLGRSTHSSEEFVVKPNPADFATSTELYGASSSKAGKDSPGIYTRHAAIRMAARGIELDWVQEALTHGVGRPSPQPGTRRYFGDRAMVVVDPVAKAIITVGYAVTP